MSRAPSTAASFRTLNLPAHRASKRASDAIVPESLGPLSRRFAHFARSRDAHQPESIRRLADDASDQAAPPDALVPGLPSLPSLPALPPWQPLGPCDPRLLPRPRVDGLPAWVRAECRRLSLPEDIVAGAYDHLAAAEAQTIRRREMREQAWKMFNANRPGCHAFWRGGFRTRWGKRVDEHDYSIIPGYDQLHGQICGFYPEWEGREYEFWCELLSPLPRLTPPRELWQAAIDAVQDHNGERRELSPPPASLPSDTEF